MTADEEDAPPRETPKAPTPDEGAEPDRDWTEVRESWVGEPAGAIPIAPYVVLPPPSPESPRMPKIELREEPPPIIDAPRTKKPQSVPPPLPASARPPPGGVVEGFDPPRLENAVATMSERLAAADYDGALRAADLLLRIDPANEQALRCRELARSELQKVYLARIGSLSGVPRLAMGPLGLRAIDIDLRAGLVLARVNGAATVDDIVRSQVIAPFDALRVLSELFLSGVLALGPSR